MRPGRFSLTGAQLVAALRPYQTYSDDGKRFSSASLCAASKHRPEYLGERIGPSADRVLLVGDSETITAIDTMIKRRRIRKGVLLRIIGSYSSLVCRVADRDKAATLQAVFG